MGSNGNRTGVHVFFWVLLCAVGWLGAGVLLLGCVIDSGGRDDENSMKVDFLDIGQGLAVLLEQSGHYALYDAGPDSAGVWDSLQARGVDSLDWVVVSHHHRDHGGGLLELSQRKGEPRVHIQKIYVGPDTAGSFVRDSVLRVAMSLNVSVDTLYRGDYVSLGTLTFKVLWPPSFVSVEGNGASLVLQGGLPEDESKVLLTGDLDSAGERRLMELSSGFQSDLLQVGHHGSAGSSSLAFLNRVSPQYAVISVGADNGYGHPTASVLRKLDYILGASSEESQAAVSRTDLDGTVSFRIIPGVGIIRK